MAQSSYVCYRKGQSKEYFYRNFEGMISFFQKYRLIEDILAINISQFKKTDKDIRKVVEQVIGIVKQNKEKEQSRLSQLKKEIQGFENIYSFRNVGLNGLSQKYIQILISLRELVKKEFDMSQQRQSSFMVKQSIFVNKIQQIIRYNKENSSLKTTVEYTIHQLNKLKQNSHQNHSRNEQIYKAQYKKDEKQFQNSNVSQIQDEENQRQKQLKILFQQKQAEIKSLQNQIQKYKNKKPFFKQNSSAQLKINRNFEILTLQLSEEYKQFIEDNILKQVKRATISKTKLLYRYDPLNTKNFHQYIDGYDNILLIIKLKNKNFVAAFSEAPFQKNQRSTQKKGLLFSLSKYEKNCFLLKNQDGAVPIIYDDYFLIFGNRDLRIRTIDSKVTSYFGMPDSFYDNKGKNTRALFSYQTKEQDFSELQIHQINFS